MAESAAPPTALQKSLECSVCLVMYDKEDHTPQGLRCQHTFCKSCLDGLSDGSMVKCPKCRGDTVSSDIRTNFTVMEMLDALCAECKQKGGDVQCRHCDVNLCQVCFDSHVQSFPDEIASKVELLKEEIDNLSESLGDISDITKENAKAENVLRKIRYTFTAYHDFLNKAQLELEKKVFNLKEKNITCLLASREDLNTTIIKATQFVEKTECLTLKLTSSVTLNDIVRFNEECSRFRERLQTKRETSLATMDYSFQETKGTSELKSYDIGEIIASAMGSEYVYLTNGDPDYTRAKVMCVAGEKGDGFNQFNSPIGVAVSSGGYIVVTDDSNHRLKVLDQNLKCVSTFGTIGKENGQFHDCGGLTVAPNGRIYVADLNNDRVHVLTMARFKVIKSEILNTTTLSRPQGLAFDTDGNLYICDRYNYRIQVVKQDGTHIKTIGSEGKGLAQFSGCPVYVAVTHGQKVLVSQLESSIIKVFDTNGGYIETYPKHAPATLNDMEPRGMTIDHVGNIIIADNKGRLVVLDKDGNFVCTIGSEGDQPGQFKQAYNVAVDGDGNIIVADRGNNRIQIFQIEYK